MKLRILSTIAILAMGQICFAQNALVSEGKDHCDCKNARYTEDANFDAIKIGSGYGELLEISGNSIKNKYLPTREHNSFWIRIKFLESTDFEFQLNPTVPTDDFDFSIWKVTGANYCDSIVNGAMPIRSNLSKRNPPKGSVTGLKKGAGRDYAPAGANSEFSNSMQVSQGEEYIILIDAPYGAEGAFNSSFDFKRQKVDTVVSEPPPVEEKPTVISQLFIRVVDEVGTSLNDADLKIRNVPRQDSVFTNEGYFVLSRIQRYRNYTIDVERKDYLSLRETYRSEEGVSDTIVLQLEKLKIGSKLQFQNILFVPDQAEIVESSYLDLRRIRNFLVSNPHINVEIMGHVNGLGNKKKLYRELSKKRARAIYDYLIGEGIFAERMTYNGYGAGQLIYKDPQTEEEARINRRVEVRITKI